MRNDQLQFTGRSHCPAESIDTEVGVFWFPETKVGNYVEKDCPYKGGTGRVCHLYEFSWLFWYLIEYTDTNLINKGTLVILPILL